MANWNYDPNVDYMELMKAADAAGNKQLAAIYEQQRNEKIRGEKLEAKYPTTKNYASYLPGGSASVGLSETLEKIGNVGNEKFTYDPETDPSMQAYRQAYLREADRGVRDTMGSYAGMTQGVPSSAAITAASQAGDYYRAQLNDKVPELEAQAYARYLNGQQQELNKLQLQQNGYEALIADAMNRWTMLGQADDYVSQVLGVPVGTTTQNGNEAKIADAMNRWTMLGRADDYVSQVLGVPVGTTTADQAYTDYQISAAKKENLMNLMATGYTPDDSELAAAGMSRREADAWKGYLAAQAAAQAARVTGTGRKPTLKLIDWEKRSALAQAYEQGGIDSIEAELDYLEKMGYNTDEFTQWLGTYHGRTPQFDDGYTTNEITSNGRSINKGRMDQKN